MSLDQSLFHQQFTKLLRAQGWPTQRAEHCAALAIVALLESHGGARHYIPARKVDPLVIQKARSNGKTIAEICRLYGIAESRVVGALKQKTDEPALLP